VFGYNQAKKQIENYALDRIQNIEKASHFFFKPNDVIDIPTYFDDIVGVTKYAEQPLDIFIIKVNLIIAPYWVNRPLHASQRLIEQTPQYYLFSFDLRWNYEWQSLILSYGANVEVIQPLWLRENIKNIYLDVCALYQ
jgi:predicted DNA-binding transcriptional regulator YafY